MRHWRQNSKCSITNRATLQVKGRKQASYGQCILHFNEEMPSWFSISNNVDSLLKPPHRNHINIGLLRFSNHQLPKTQHIWNSNSCFQAFQWPWPDLFRATCFILGLTYGNWNSMLTELSFTSVCVLPSFHRVVECKAQCACYSYKMLRALCYTTVQTDVTTLVVKAC